MSEADKTTVYNLQAGSILRIGAIAGFAFGLGATTFFAMLLGTMRLLTWAGIAS